VKLHPLKTWPEYFEAIGCGHKTFEARKDDRGFQVGDVLLLEEFDPAKSTYTGRHIFMKISYILRGPGFGIESGYCVMSLSPQ
jgi:hypothetical protein